jgi:hypothetical protein
LLGLFVLEFNDELPLVWMALAIMPAYCMKLVYITQDVVFIFLINCRFGWRSTSRCGRSSNYKLSFCFNMRV